MRNKCVHPREQDQEFLGGGSEPWSSARVSWGLGLLAVTWGCCSHTSLERVSPWPLVSAWETDSAPALKCPEQETKPFLSLEGWKRAGGAPLPTLCGTCCGGAGAAMPQGTLPVALGYSKKLRKDLQVCTAAVVVESLWRQSLNHLFSRHPPLRSKLFFQARTIWCYMHRIWNTQLQPSPRMSSPAGISNADSPGRGTVIGKRQPGLDFLQTCVCLSVSRWSLTPSPLLETCSGCPFGVCFGNKHSLLNSTSHRLADNASTEIYFDSLGFRQLVLHFGFGQDATWH